MSDIVIKAEHVSKKYILNKGGSSEYKTIRESLVYATRDLGHAIVSPFQKGRHGFTEKQTFWALDNVSFEVSRGERLGIIGGNGAGKSTLLKILSRIVDPTKGEITITGRVASLLEVGTGFHPELTGRENIFLNGAILGITRADIVKRFDEIVSFSEIEGFLDTPVKRYSSGMYVRLAFAVAAHMEPEILIVDEVLAVGDAQFQKKCLGKMEDVSKSEGRTIILVSHNMTAVKALCNRAILLDKGRIKYDDTPAVVIDRYLNTSYQSCEGDVPIALRTRERRFSLRATIVDFKVVVNSQVNPERLDSKSGFEVIFDISTDYDNVKVSPQFIIADGMQNLSLFDAGTAHGKLYVLQKGLTRIVCAVSALNFYAGNYRIHCYLTLPGQEVIDGVTDAYIFTIDEFDPYDSGYSIKKEYGFGIFHVDYHFKEAEKIEQRDS